MVLLPQVWSGLSIAATNDHTVNTPVEAIENGGQPRGQKPPGEEAQTPRDEPRLPPLAQLVPTVHPGFDEGILVNLPALTLYYYSGGGIAYAGAVAVGRPEAPTPLGEFKILTKVVDPVWVPPAPWYPPESRIPVPPGPQNPLGRRWIGFAPGYGIHGNNSPSSIGRAVSLGCIRMSNADIEWLFEKVRKGLPVRVIYRTVEVRFDPADGQNYLVIHPDVYNRMPLTPSLIRQVLSENGLEYQFAPGEMESLTDRAATGHVALPLGVKVLLNGRLVASNAFLSQGSLMLPLRQLAEALELQVDWDETTRTAVVGGSEVKGHLANGRTFLTAKEAGELFDVDVAYRSADRIADISAVTVRLNGYVLTRRAYLAGGSAMAPLEALRWMVRGELYWEPDARVAYFKGHTLPGEMKDGRAYLPVRRVGELEGARVSWDATNKVVDLTVYR